METMLAVGINALFCGLVFKWASEPSGINGWLVGIVSFAAFLTRPESAMPSLLTIGLVTLLFRSKRFHPGHALVPICILVGGILACLVTCKFYFHSALPLAFYVKGHRLHPGYLTPKQPVHRALQFFGACGAFVLLLIWLTKPKHLRITIAFLVPLLVATFYLCTVWQIMGHQARYYLPYLPYAVFPAMIILDERLIDGGLFQIENPLLRVSLSALMFVVLGGVLPDSVIQKVDDWVEGPRIRYAEAQRMVDAKVPLPPVEWMRGWRDLTDNLVAELPKGATVAATEVGYLGAIAAHVNVIDLSGLNDTQIALHGLSVPDVLERKPDLIWLPFIDNTYKRGLFFDSKDFLSNYVVFDGALSYGIALRKDSPYYSQMMLGMQRIWVKEYSGYSMQDYVVKSATWDRTPKAF
jgi:hypothetical protein